MRRSAPLLLALWLLPVLARREYGNYDFQMGFYTGLREVLLGKDFDLQYRKHFRGLHPNRALMDDIDTCDLSRFDYTPKSYLVPDGTMDDILKKKEVVIGYTGGLDIFTKFQLDLCVQSIRNMLRAYAVSDGKGEGKTSSDASTPQMSYNLLGEGYKPDMDLDLSYEKEGDIRIEVKKFKANNGSSKYSSYRNYDMIMWTREFNSVNYNAITNMLRENQTSLEEFGVFGCNIARVDIYRLCLSSTETTQKIYQIKTLLVNIDKSSGYLTVESFGDAIRRMLKTADTSATSSEEGNSCVFVPYELYFFATNHTRELCEAYADDDKKDRLCNSSGLHFTGEYIELSFRIAPLFNISLPGNKKQPQDYTLFSSILDTLMKNDGNRVDSGAVAKMVSTLSNIPRTSEMIIPYALELTLSTFMLGTDLYTNIQETELFDFTDYDSNSNNEEKIDPENAKLEKDGKEFLGVAVSQLSELYGRNLVSCHCQNMSKITKDVIAHSITDEFSTKVEGITCDVKDINKNYDRSVMVSDMSNNMFCQVGYGGIIWKQDTVGTAGAFPGTMYRQEDLQYLIISTNDVAKDCKEFIPYRNGCICDGEPYPLEKCDEGSGLEEYLSLLEENRNISFDTGFTPDATCYFGFASQIDKILIGKEHMNKKYVGDVDHRATEKPSTDGGDKSKIFSKANFVNVYNSGKTEYILNPGRVDSEARKLGTGMVAYTTVVVALGLILLVWRIIRCTCGSIVAAGLREKAEAFEERRDR